MAAALVPAATVAVAGGAVGFADAPWTLGDPEGRGIAVELLADDGLDAREAAFAAVHDERAGDKRQRADQRLPRNHQHDAGGDPGASERHDRAGDAARAAEPARQLDRLPLAAGTDLLRLCQLPSRRGE